MQRTGGSSGCQEPPLFHSWQVRDLRAFFWSDVGHDNDGVDDADGVDDNGC